MTLSIPLARLNVLCQTINSTESLEIQQLLRLKVSLESCLEIQWNMALSKNDMRKLTEHSVNPEQEWFKQCLRDKTKLCIWEYLRDISIKKLMNANTNSQCSQSNDLLVIIYELYNKHNIRLILWHIFQRISFYNTKITSYLHWDIQSSYEWNNNTRYLLAKASHKKQELCALHLLAVCGISAQWIMILRDIS